MSRRGRPRGGDSAETRVRILDAARAEFAVNGYDGASVATIASQAQLAPSAVYHYFGGKAALYEEVHEVTAEIVWSLLADQSSAQTLLASVEQLVNDTGAITRDKPHYNSFLALVPMEASLHPEFAHMFDLRIKRQDELFGSMAELGLRTGELKGFSLVTATEMLRALFMGWFVENHFRSSGLRESRESVITLIRLLGDRKHPNE